MKNKRNNSILLINKKKGITSHDEVNRVRRILSIKKVGHSGTLDPKVTGMLLMGIGSGVKILEYMLSSRKTYIAEFVLHKKVSQKQLEKVLLQYIGVIKQTPPRKSSVKRQNRKREIYQLEILKFDSKKKKALINCQVQKGTYIRKLVHDIGVDLKVGAHMGKLHRTQVGVFSEKEQKVISTKKLKYLIVFEKIFPPFGIFVDKYFYSIKDVLRKWPKVVVDMGAVKSIKNGAPLYAPGVVKISGNFFKSDEVLLLDSKEEKEIAIGEALCDYQTIMNLDKGAVCAVKKQL